MSRRRFLQVAGVAGAAIGARVRGARAAESAPADIFGQLVRANDSRIPVLLERQETSPSHPWRGALRGEVAIDIDLYDETNTVIPIRSIIRKMKGYASGMVGFVGVQTNQFPRAVDLADHFLNANIPVAIGGFHVSGCVAMLPTLPRDLQVAVKKGISLFAGEAEGHLDEVLRDAYAGKLKPLYNFLNEGRSLESSPSPFLPVQIVKNTFRRLSSFDAGRGCPFQCSFCTIINVQGRKSRYRSADDIEHKKLEELDLSDLIEPLQEKVLKK